MPLTLFKLFTQALKTLLYVGPLAAPFYSYTSHLWVVTSSGSRRLMKPAWRSDSLCAHTCSTPQCKTHNFRELVKFPLRSYENVHPQSMVQGIFMWCQSRAWGQNSGAILKATPHFGILDVVVWSLNSSTANVIWSFHFQILNCVSSCSGYFPGGQKQSLVSLYFWEGLR